ncbi:hypothetical protein NRS6141_00772 [Bacillus subtilis]|nr:hypothetical protein NRS6141_00772 [Bacillus subtilis]CAF1877136.1 hypothetical protein NRS6204_00340 [Bacillus subtilis]CAF1879151.1 hypothetical protein NRS6205_00340 [Bacillus subtilis]
MPNKNVDDLKHEGSRWAAQQWKDALGLDKMTTREWNHAADRAANGDSDQTIRKSILDSRRK